VHDPGPEGTMRKFDYSHEDTLLILNILTQEGKMEARRKRVRPI
jgi:hypothetical protein